MAQRPFKSAKPHRQVRAKLKVSRRTLLKAAALAAIAGGGVTAALKRRAAIMDRAKRLNATYKKKNADPGIKAEHMPTKVNFSLKRGGWYVFNPNEPGYCSAYAVRWAESKFGGSYERAPAWELAKKNNLVDTRTRASEGFKKDEILRLIGRSRTGPVGLRPGYCIGTYYADSPNNMRGRSYTHLVVFKGRRNGEPIFVHNFGGPHEITLNELLTARSEKNPRKRKFLLLEVIAPL